MRTLRLEDLKQYSDVLRTRQGEPLNVRFIEPRDTEELQLIHARTMRSRHPKSRAVFLSLNRTKKPC